MDFQGMLPTTAAIERLIYSSVLTMDHDLPVLMQVINGKETAAEAIAYSEASAYQLPPQELSPQDA